MDTRAQSLSNEGEVDFLSRGVDDEPQRAVGAGWPRDHKVIDDSAGLVEQLGVTLTARGEVQQVCGTEGFKKARDRRVVSAFDQRLAHVRNIEKPGGVPGVEVLGEDP